MTAEAQGAPGELPVTVVSSRPHMQWWQTVRDLLAYRELFLAFVARDLKVRYKQTALGAIWVILQPLVTGGVFAIVMQKLRGGPLSGAEFATSLLFFMAGLVPWNTFAGGVQKAATSLEGSANLITKIYFPRLAVPGAYIAGSMVDFVIAFGALLALAAAMGTFAGMMLVWMLPLLLLQVTAAAGLGFFFAALNAQYRDVKYVIPFLLNVGMLITVLLPLSAWSPPVQMVLSFNPMAAVIETYRAVLDGTAVDWLLLGKGMAVSVLVLLGGTWFFRAREARLVDIL